MGLLAWLLRLRERQRAALLFEAAWTVSLDADVIGVTDAEGSARAVSLAAIENVVVETNDGGPFIADVWWLLYGADGTLRAGWPQGATGEQAAVDRLMALPGFDHRRAALAMASTVNALFVLWTRQEQLDRTR